MSIDGVMSEEVSSFGLKFKVSNLL